MVNQPQIAKAENQSISQRLKNMVGSVNVIINGDENRVTVYNQATLLDGIQRLEKELLMQEMKAFQRENELLREERDMLRQLLRMRIESE